MSNVVKPQDPQFESIVRESFRRQTMMETIGARLMNVFAGGVDVEVAFDARLCQQNGFLHAGVTASVADSANGYAALTLAAAETEVLTVEFKINLLAPAVGRHFLASGRVVRAGTTLTVCQANVFSLFRHETALIATMVSTIVTKPRIAFKAPSPP